MTLDSLNAAPAADAEAALLSCRGSRTFARWWRRAGGLAAHKPMWSPSAPMSLPLESRPPSRPRSAWV